MWLPEFVFWFSALVVLLVYVGYPAFVWLLGHLVGKGAPRRRDIQPCVTVIIPVHNEEDIIREKLENCLRVDYPRDKLQIVVASDGSTDDTNRLVRSFSGEGVRLVELPTRGGKTRAINCSMEAATGDIVVFTDANAFLQPEAVSRLARNFADPEVGCACGQRLYVDHRGYRVEEGEGLYWKYERFVKECESRLHSVMGADGAIFAIRRDLYRPLDPTLIDDLVTSLRILAEGHRVVSEPSAYVHERVAATGSEEFGRKKRIVARAMRGLAYMRALLNPVNHPLFSVQLFVHKVLRWLVPVFLGAMLLANAALLDRWPYALAFVAQVIFYGAAAIGALAGPPAGEANRLISIPYYFCLVNVAAVAGLSKFLLGRVDATWESSPSSREPLVQSAREHDHEE
jgi:cellulose synthase/poly-beta-1,6-N-acetylglucosamine synthase-like glycosyltransferase